MKELKSGYILLSILTMIAFSGTILNAQVHQGADCTDCHYSGNQEDSEGCNNCPNIKHVRCDISGFGTVTFPPYVSGEEPYDGVCEVCHVLWNGENGTKYYTNTGDGATHYDGADCIPCHRHSDPPGDGDMFSPQVIGPQSHNTHFQDNKGPHLSTCTACHHPDDDDFSLFADDEPKETTTVCDNCHSDGGAYYGVQMAKDNWEHGVYVTVPEWQPETDYETDDLVKYLSDLYECIYDFPFTSGSSFDETKWEFIYKMGSGSEALQRGKGQWCVTCHDGDVADEDNLPANSKADGSGVWAPNVDLYYTSGHGRPGADVECLGCHDASFAHIDGEPRTYDVDDATTPATVINEYVDSYRLNANLDVPRQFDEPGQYELCIQCHEGVFEPSGSNFKHLAFDLHPEHMAYDFPVWDSNVNGGEIFGIWREDSAMTCPTCHNPHGTQMNLLNDPNPPDTCTVMIRDGRLTEPADERYGLYFHWYTEQYGEVGSGQLTPDLPATRSGQMLCRPPFCANQHCHGAYPYYNRVPTGDPPEGTTIISESFEGANYEEAFTESVGTNCILDEDSSIPGTPPIDFGSQCLKSVSNATGYKARADLVYSSEQANTHTTFYVYVQSESLGSNDNKNIGALINANGQSAVVLRLFQGSAGSLKFRFRLYNNGTSTNYNSSAISLNTWYKIEIKYDDTNNTWEWLVDDVSRNAGTLTGTHYTGIKQWRLGFWQSSQAQTGTIYFDELTAESFE